MKSYENEARERYGNTAAYREHEQKTKNYTKEKWTEVNDGLMAFFAEFAARAEDGKVDVVEIQAAENTVPDRYGMIFRSVVTVDISKHITLDHKRSLFTDNIRFL